MLKKNMTKNKKNNPSPFINIFLNSLIVILTIFIGVFIYSFSNKQIHNGRTFEINFPQTKTPPPLTTTYIENPISKFPIEVLNGCGVKGLAGEVSNFFRLNNIDVLNSDDADNYEYSHTLVILRKGNDKILETVSSLLELNLEDKNHILNEPDSNSEVDLTVIIGNDYKTIQPIMKLLNKNN